MMIDAMIAQDPPEWRGMAADRSQTIAQGEEAISVQRQGLNRIFAVGHAFEAMQQEAMLRSHSNQSVGKRYNEAYATLAKPVPELTKVNKTDRNQYVWCWLHHDELQRWWQTIAQSQRDRWNHPDAIKRHYLAATATSAPAEELAPRPSLSARKDIEIARLQEELDTANRKLAALERANGNITEGRDWTWHDTVEQIAAAMLQTHPDKAKRLGSALQNLAKSTTRKPKYPAA